MISSNDRLNFVSRSRMRNRIAVGRSSSSRARFRACWVTQAESALVAGPPQEGRHLLLDRPLEDELGAQAAERAEGVGIGEPRGQGRFDGRLDLDAGGYSLFHGVVSFCGLQVRFGAYAVFTFTAVSGRHLRRHPATTGR